MKTIRIFLCYLALMIFGSMCFAWTSGSLIVNKVVNYPEIPLGYTGNLTITVTLNSTSAPYGSDPGKIKIGTKWYAPTEDPANPHQYPITDSVANFDINTSVAQQNQLPILIFDQDSIFSSTSIKITVYKLAFDNTVYTSTYESGAYTEAVYTVIKTPDDSVFIPYCAYAISGTETDAVLVFHYSPDSTAFKGTKSPPSTYDTHPGIYVHYTWADQFPKFTATLHCIKP